MAKEELLEFDGTVVEVLPDGNYRVKLDNEHIILAYAARKIDVYKRQQQGSRAHVAADACQCRCYDPPEDRPVRRRSRLAGQ